MQSYPITLLAGGAAVPLMVDAELFVFESGTTSGDLRITVRPDNGSEMVLRPGQSFRIKSGARCWTVRAYDGAAAMTCNLVIGKGEFFDRTAQVGSSVSISNNAAQRVPVQIDPVAPLLIGNTAAQRVPVQIDPVAPLLIGNTAAQRVPVTVDPAGPLLIGNTTAQRVPVAVDPTAPLLIGNTSAQRVPVAIDPTAPLLIGNTAAQRVPVVSTLHDVVSYCSTTQAATTILVSPAANVNGILLYNARIDSDNGNSGLSNTFLAKVGVPANNFDGDVLLCGRGSGTDYVTLQNPVRIAPGKGLYLYIASPTAALVKHAVYAIL